MAFITSVITLSSPSDAMTSTQTSMSPSVRTIYLLAVTDPGEMPVSGFPTFFGQATGVIAPLCANIGVEAVLAGIRLPRVLAPWKGTSTA